MEKHNMQELTNILLDELSELKKDFPDFDEKIEEVYQKVGSISFLLEELPFNE